MRRHAVIATLMVWLGQAATAVSGSRYANVSGPTFLRSIGPRDPRVDNPLAAVFVAGVVAAVIYRGLRQHENKQ